jgi:starch synthase
LRVLSVASEVYPLIKTGGLADVAGALPGALKTQRISVRTLVLDKLQAAIPVVSETGYFGGNARILAGRADGRKLFVLDAPHLYARLGNPYSAPNGQDWPDNPLRFAALAYAAALIGWGGVPDFVPDVVHAHDWQAGLAPAYLEFAGKRPATVMTIHNLAFQGQVPAWLLETLRQPAAAYTPDGVEYYGAIGMLKAGLRYADRITTVSPSYAAEICTPEDGMGMDGLLRARADRLSGIINGIDTEIWNPAADPFLPAPFSADTIAGRAASKAALQERFSLTPDPAALVIGVVSRLSHQKGIDVLLSTLDTLLGAGAQLAVLGSGDSDLQAGVLQASAQYPGRVGVVLGYDERFAHVIQAGSDCILVPSRFEPCGLTQLCALRYGALPLVSRVGGLADTVIDANAAARLSGVATGVQFAPVTPMALRSAILRMAELWRHKAEWAGMQQRAMRSDVSWAEPAKLYAALYEDAIAGRT